MLNLKNICLLCRPHDLETLSALVSLYEGDHIVTGGFPQQRVNDGGDFFPLPEQAIQQPIESQLI